MRRRITQREEHIFKNRLPYDWNPQSHRSVTGDYEPLCELP